MRMTPFKIGTAIILLTVFGLGVVPELRRRHRRPR